MTECRYDFESHFQERRHALFLLQTDLYQTDLVAGYYQPWGEDRKPDARASEFLCSHWFEGKDYYYSLVLAAAACKPLFLWDYD